MTNVIMTMSHKRGTMKWNDVPLTLSIFVNRKLFRLLSSNILFYLTCLFFPIIFCNSMGVLNLSLKGFLQACPVIWNPSALILIWNTSDLSIHTNSQTLVKRQSVYGLLIMDQNLSFFSPNLVFALEISTLQRAIDLARQEADQVSIFSPNFSQIWQL